MAALIFVLSDLFMVHEEETRTSRGILSATPSAPFAEQTRFTANQGEFVCRSSFPCSKPVYRVQWEERFRV
jgi:hypothetical protein